MRVLHKRLVGLGGPAFCKPWYQLISTKQNAEAEVQTSNPSARSDADAAFLQLLSQSFVPSTTDSSPTCRPVLANLPAAVELLERAILPTPPPQPLYDLPTFLAISYPQAGVRPHNPGYDWCSWARANIPEAGKANASQRDAQLALLGQVDAHMQLPTSRQALLRIAKLELAHLWYRQQQQQQQQLAGSLNSHQDAALCEPDGERTSLQGGVSGTAPHASPSGGLEASQPAQQPHERGEISGLRANVLSPELPPAAGPASTALPAWTPAADGAEDDIFAAADRRTRARTEQRQRREEEQQQRQLVAQQHAASRDPLSALPPDVQLRLRELQRRAEVYSHKSGGPLAAVIRSVGDAFGQRISYSRDVHGSAGVSGGVGADGATRAAAVVQTAMEVSAQAVRGLQGRRTANPADAQLPKSGTSGPSLTYWVEHPLLSYTDNIVTLAARETAARRSKTADGLYSSNSAAAAAVTSLSASLQRPVMTAAGGDGGGGSGASSVLATPVLTLLLDYLKVKYLDVLHAWEVAARLRQAAERAEREAEQERAKMTIQAGNLLPDALREELARSWGQAAAAFHPEVLAPVLQSDAATGAASADGTASLHRSLAAPLDWSHAVEVLQEQAAQCRKMGVKAGGMDAAAVIGAAAAAKAAVASGDLRTAVQHAMAPVVAATAARHKRLLASRTIGGQGAREGAASPVDVGAVAPSFTGPQAVPGPAAASLVCIRETMVLDAASGFEDSSHDCRVSLEFDVDRLAAREPSLGGTWSTRFLERLLTPQGCDSPQRHRSAPGGSMTGRARRSPAARSAFMALAYPVDIERSFCRRTRAATLSTARYASREANRKLLLEHYTELLRVLAKVATSAAASPGTGHPVAA